MNLKLRWARFFTIAGWDWSLSRNPRFDFLVKWPGVDSDDNCEHFLHVRVCDESREELASRRAGIWDATQTYTSPHPALFGDGPENTFFSLIWGMGGGEYSLPSFGKPGMREIWERAAHD